jgi:adenosine kinase
VIVSPNDPAAMARYAEESRRSGVPFLYDPSQQVARLSGEELRQGLSGAAILIVNDYEFGILTQKTGLSREDAEDRVPAVVVTHGPDGSTIAVAAGKGRSRRHEVPAARIEKEAIDPTGVGDAFRAGLVRGLRIGAPWPVAGRMGSVSAVFCLEALGPQPPRYSIDRFRARYERNFGEEPLLERLRERSRPDPQLTTDNSQLG